MKDRGKKRRHGTLEKPAAWQRDHAGQSWREKRGMEEEFARWRRRERN
jgi:hypothetical protein